MSKERKPYCFTDFDGTLTDNRQRLFHFYTEHIPEAAQKLVSIGDFWERKRRGIHEIGYLKENFSEDAIREIDRAAYDAEKKRVVENDEYLALDEVFPYAAEALAKLKDRYELILVTRRSQEDAFRKEWEQTGLAGYFSAVHVIPHSYGGKAEYLAEHYEIDPGRDLMIGDTEDDIRAGLALGVKTYLVLSGIRDEQIVKKCSAEGKVLVAKDIAAIAESLLSY